MLTEGMHASGRCTHMKAEPPQLACYTGHMHSLMHVDQRCTCYKDDISAARLKQ